MPIKNKKRRKVNIDHLVIFTQISQASKSCWLFDFSKDFSLDFEERSDDPFKKPSKSEELERIFVMIFVRDFKILNLNLYQNAQQYAAFIDDYFEGSPLGLDILTIIL